MRRLLVVLGAAAVAAGAMCIASAQEPTAWKAGVAAVKITPQGPIWMAGYTRKTPSQGVARDLWAKALAIEDPRGTRLLVVTMDLIGVPRSLRDWLEAETQKKYGLGRASLLMNCSHTHCGPELDVADLARSAATAPFAPVSAQYVAQLKQKLAALVGDALAHLAPARLDFLKARAGFAMNRRRPLVREYRNAPYFEGPVDHDVPVLRVTDPQDKLLALLFGYACHNTTMGDCMIRGDYAGYAQQYKATGKIRTTYPCPIQVVRFGRDLTLVALGGETVVDYALRLKRELAGPSVWVAGYCNDVFEYLPSARVLREGGYEAGGAALWGSLPGPFTSSVEERVVSKALALARTPIESMPAAVDHKTGNTRCSSQTLPPIRKAL